jgi:hypothetical protein
MMPRAQTDGSFFWTSGKLEIQGSDSSSCATNKVSSDICWQNSGLKGGAICVETSELTSGAICWQNSELNGGAICWQSSELKSVKVDASAIYWQFLY